MFVEHKEAGEVTEAPAKTLKLSEAIRIGIKSVPEAFSFCGCAMGAAYFALTGRNLGHDQDSNYYPKWGNGEHIVAKLTGVPYETVVFASRKHYNRKWSRAKCADWLEAQGY